MPKKCVSTAYRLRIGCVSKPHPLWPGPCTYEVCCPSTTDSIDGERDGECGLVGWVGEVGECAGRWVVLVGRWGVGGCPRNLALDCFPSMLAGFLLVSIGLL